MDYNIHMNKKNHGFTLIELMVTLAVFGLLIAFAAPNVTSLMRSNRLSTQSNEFVGALTKARDAATKGSVVTLCITDGNTPPNCDSASTSWESGWIIFTDLDGDVSFNGASESLIRIHAALSDGYTLTSTHFEGVPYALQYSPTGRLRALDGDSTTSPQRTFTLCDPYTGNQLRAKGTNINRLGSVQRAVDTDADNISNDIATNNLTCPPATI